MLNASPPFVAEGLRALPAWQYHLSKNDVPQSSCERCRFSKGPNGDPAATVQVRQAYACPYEPPTTSQYITIQRPDGLAGKDLTVCPTYSTTLPETIEIARAWGWKQDLRVFCGGKWPTEALVHGVELFGGHVEEFKNKLITPKSKGGMADG